MTQRRTCAQQELFPISERDTDGNTYQTRTLNDGSLHRVLKNFPSADEVVGLVAPMAPSLLLTSMSVLRFHAPFAAAAWPT